MALPDLTGQNIQDTYQRVLQTDNGTLRDGTGSAVTHLTVDGTVTANSVTLTGAPTKTDIDALDITEVGALDSGSITSGFGAIDNGSSNSL